MTLTDNILVSEMALLDTEHRTGDICIETWAMSFHSFFGFLANDTYDLHFACTPNDSHPQYHVT
jgi:predicted dehydrogenase